MAKYPWPWGDPEPKPKKRRKNPDGPAKITKRDRKLLDGGATNWKDERRVKYPGKTPLIGNPNNPGSLPGTKGPYMPPIGHPRNPGSDYPPEGPLTPAPNDDAAKQSPYQRMKAAHEQRQMDANPLVSALAVGGLNLDSPMEGDPKGRTFRDIAPMFFSMRAGMPFAGHGTPQQNAQWMQQTMPPPEPAGGGGNDSGGGPQGPFNPLSTPGYGYLPSHYTSPQYMNRFKGMMPDSSLGGVLGNF
jgi:hypothetical protein